MPCTGEQRFRGSLCELFTAELFTTGRAVVNYAHLTRYRYADADTARTAAHSRSDNLRLLTLRMAAKFKS